MFKPCNSTRFPGGERCSLPFDHAERCYFPSEHKPTAVTLFSGLGSSSKALRDLGYNVLPHDFNRDAVATLQANGFTEARLANVKDIDYSDPRYSDVQVLAGGPPCQPFSQSHQGDGQYDPRDMIPEFIRAVAEMLPSLFVMEEVQTLTWKKHAAYLAKVEDDMRALGYVVEHRVLNAAEHGLAQARKRLFVVGVRQDVADRWALHGVDAVRWPEKSEGPTMAATLGWDLLEVYRRNQAVPDPRAHASSMHDPLIAWPHERSAMTVVGSFRPEVMAAPGYRKAGDPPRQATPGSVVVTFEERLKLQDMPIGWTVIGSQASRDLQVGNSVPCGLIRDLIDVNIP